MVKQKKNVVQPSDVPGPKSVIQEGGKGGVEMRIAPTMKKQGEKDGDDSVRILFHGKCPKLTPRGIGSLEYEIGIDEDRKEGVLRITRNESSGAFSTHWIGLKGIRTVVEALKGEPFRGVIFRDLFRQKSSNNHGFLAAVLKAEGVLETFPKQPTVMRLESWKPLLEKIDELKKADVSLTDHLGIAAKRGAEKKVRNMAKVRESSGRQEPGGEASACSGM